MTKRVFIITLCAITALTSGWIFHRTEADVGRVLNDQGDGKLYNGEPFYNYIHYDESRFNQDDIVLTVDLLNPLNTYEDDIIWRYDIALFEDTKGATHEASIH